MISHNVFFLKNNNIHAIIVGYIHMAVNKKWETETFFNFPFRIMN